MSQRLRQAALQRLSEQDRRLIQSHTHSDFVAVSEQLDWAIKLARQQQQQYKDTRWTFALSNRTVTLQEEADKVVLWLNRFKDLGDVVANADPAHIGLPWAGFLFLLQVLESDVYQRESLLVGCEMLLYMSNRLEAYLEFRHRLAQSQVRDNFEDALIQLQAHVFGFLAQTVRIYQNQSAHRAIRAFWDCNKIIEFETRGEQLAAQLETEADKCDRTLYQQYTQESIDKIEKLHQDLYRSIGRAESKVDLDKLNRLPYVADAEFNAHEADDELCHPGTRLDILHQIIDWARDPYSKGVFWLKGVAGTGKSTIAYTIARRLHDPIESALPVQLGASFFFKRGEHDRDSARRLFPTIARRLAYQLPAIASLVIDLISAEPDICEKKLGEQFERLIYQPLQIWSASMGDNEGVTTLIVILDALDECDKSEEIETLLELWARLAQLTKIKLKLFLTSQPDFKVQQLENMSASVRRDAVLHDVPPTEIEGDLSLFLRGQLSKSQQPAEEPASKPSSDDTWPSEEGFQILLKLTIPLFISAATACRFIHGGSSPAPQERLKQLTSAQQEAYPLPLIDKLYLTILGQLTTSYEEPNDRDVVYAKFQLIVGSIITLTSPLPVRSLAKLLQLDLGSIQSFLSTLDSVLRVPSDPSKTVRTLHSSFRDFLLNSNGSAGPYAISESSAHYTLLLHCLDLLGSQDGLKENMCDMKSPGQLRKDIDMGVIQKCLSAEVQYACRNWVYHAQRCDRQITNDGAVHHFLQHHFLHWLEALSLMGKISTAVGALSDLITVVPDGSSILLDFLKDAQRFVLAYRHVAALTPLQLYSSAIIFSPQESLVRRIYDQVPSWIRGVPTVPHRGSFSFQKLEGHASRVSAIAFSPHDDGLLASASDDYTVRLWDATSGQEMQRLIGHHSWVTAVAFCPHDDRLLASASDDYTLRLWDTLTGLEAKRLEGHTSCVTSVAFSSHDNKTLASASADRTVRLWNIRTGQETLRLEGHTHEIHAVVFSPHHDKLLASASSDKSVRLWDMTTGQEVRKFEGHTSDVQSVVYSLRDDKLLASASRDDSVRLWDMTTGQEVQKLGGDFRHVHSVVFSPYDNKTIVSASGDRTVRLWDVRTGQMVQKLVGHTKDVNAVSFSHDGKLLASASSDQTIRLWDTFTKEETQTAKGHTKRVTAVALSVDGKLAASASWDCTVKLWDTVTGHEVQNLEGHTDKVRKVTFSADATLVASASADGTIRLWDSMTGQEVQKLDDNMGVATAVTFSTNNLLAATASGSHERMTRLWDTKTGRVVQRLKGHDNAVLAVAFSVDGKQLASASMDCTVRLWSVVTGQELHKLEGHGDWVRAAAFSTDGKLVASASYGTVMLWDTTTGKEVQQFRHGARTVRFDTDGFTILTDKGSLQIDRALVSAVPPGGTSQSSAGSVTINKDWIQWQDQNILWLPEEYRARLTSAQGNTAVEGNTVVIGLESGHVSIVRIDFSQHMS